MTFATPLKWPEGWKRYAGFRAGNGANRNTWDKIKDGLYHELEMLKVKDVVISSNLSLNMRGEARGDGARRWQVDPGVAVYFTREGKQMVMARDKFDNVADNLNSLRLAIEGLRQMERHGGAALLERAFDGFMALPSQAHWRTMLGVGAAATLAEAEDAYRRGAKLLHADTGGDHEAMIQLNAAIAQARKELS